MLLLPTPRTAYDRLSAAYTRFVQLYNRGALADAWPLAAEIEWHVLRVSHSDDFELRAALRNVPQGLRSLRLMLLEKIEQALQPGDASPQGHSPS